MSARVVRPDGFDSARIESKSGVFRAVAPLLTKLELFCCLWWLGAHFVRDFDASRLEFKYGVFRAISPLLTELELFLRFSRHLVMVKWLCLCVVSSVLWCLFCCFDDDAEAKIAVAMVGE